MFPGVSRESENPDRSHLLDGDDEAVIPEPAWRVVERIRIGALQRRDGLRPWVTSACA